MGSPVKIPFKSLIVVDKSSNTPVYLQISRQLINAIQRGVLVDKIQLPGTRALSVELDVHRKTVIAAYDELYAQGWIQVKPNKGTFVNNQSNIAKPDALKYHTSYLNTYPDQTGFHFKKSILLDHPYILSEKALAFTDGLPDIRLAPLDRLAKIYGGILRRKTSIRHLGYSHIEGNEFYREALAYYLNNTRGLPIQKDNILTTRGVHMGIYLTSKILLSTGDTVIVGHLGYYIANMIFQQSGAYVEAVTVDQQGISVDAIEAICKKKKVRMVYITPHHHYPTTVTLSAERRLALLQLAARFGFIILEDDYDFDFHYKSSAVLPLASADTSGMVVYIGSFCKALAPGLRAGYIIAPKNLIAELAKLRRIVDRQSDMLMEQALGELLTEGEVHRHIKKCLKIYEERCLYFGSLLSQQLGAYLQFKLPSGGLALWSSWNEAVNLLKVSKICKKHNLDLPHNLLYQNQGITAMRLGFGNLSLEEMEKAVHILEQATHESLTSS